MLLKGEEKKCFKLHIHLNSLKYQNSVKECECFRGFI